MENMVEFKKLLNDDYMNNEVVKKILNIVYGICESEKAKINNISFYKVTFENDSWIDINFNIPIKNLIVITQMNVKLAEHLEKCKDFLASKEEYIPSFVIEERS